MNLFTNFNVCLASDCVFIYILINDQTGKQNRIAYVCAIDDAINFTSFFHVQIKCKHICAHNGEEKL